MPGDLTILGAAYGPADVTAKVWSCVRNQSLNIQASDSVFGDTWSGAKKSLVVVYKYTETPVLVATAQQGQTITLSPPTSTAPPAPRINKAFASDKLTSIANTVSRSCQLQPSDQQLTILGAAYGIADVTSTAQKKVQDDTVFDQPANDQTWGDGDWSGNSKKTLVVVYTYGGRMDVPMLNVAKENETMYFLVSPPLYILGAAYGLAPVTAQVQDMVVNRQLHVTADNSTFGDTWHGVKKSLVVTYQFGDEEPGVISVAEKSSMSILYAQNDLSRNVTAPNYLSIISSVYGLGDVTAKCQSLVQGNCLDVTANDATFGDTWHGVKKSLVTVYQYGANPPLMVITPEGSQQEIANKPTPSYPGVIDASGILDDGDKIAISASNNMFVKYNSNCELIASATSATKACQLIVERKSDKSSNVVLLKDEIGNYVTVGQESHLYLNGNQSTATPFLVSYSMYGGLRFATASKPSRYVRLGLEGNSLIADAVDNFSASAAFDIAINISEEAAMKFRSSRTIEMLSDCEMAQLSFVWQLTGGFFLAIGYTETCKYVCGEVVRLACCCKYVELNHTLSRPCCYKLSLIQVA